VADFHPQEPLTGAALGQALQALWAEQHPFVAPPQIQLPVQPPAGDATDPAPPPVTDPQPAPEAPPPPLPSFIRLLAVSPQPVTMRQLQISLVGYLGLEDAAQAVRAALQQAALDPPQGAGSEVVARLLELRTNHPASQESLELLPTQPATRAEAAYSLARLLQLDQASIDWVRESALSFALPPLGDWQRKVLARAVHFIGYPYVWGGTSEYPEAPVGVPAPGGFDCSGFVWRVYKTEPFAGAPQLSWVLRGRTTFQMSGEVPKSKRVPAEKLQPADVMFFGHGPGSKPSVIDHTGIYLGNGWFIQSSGQGVTIVPFWDWYRRSFAWGRRPLHEAGLT
jgi:cell wall-associated NlpC family hydrolase